MSQEWVPRNWWQYTLTIIAIILLGIFYELLKVGRSIWEGYMSKRREAEVLGFAIQRQAQFPSSSGRDSLFRAARTYGSFVGREDHHGIHSGLDDADLSHDHKHHHHQSRSSSGNQPLLLAPRDATGLLNRRCVRHCPQCGRVSRAGTGRWRFHGPPWPSWRR